MEETNMYNAIAINGRKLGEKIGDEEFIQNMTEYEETHKIAWELLIKTYEMNIGLRSTHLENSRITDPTVMSLITEFYSLKVPSNISFYMLKVYDDREKLDMEKINNLKKRFQCLKKIIGILTSKSQTEKISLHQVLRFIDNSKASDKEKEIAKGVILSIFK